MEDIVEAHRLMEQGGANGKIVALTPFGRVADSRRNESDKADASAVRVGP